MQPDEPTEEERAEQLNQDGQTPFQPADPNPSATGNTTDPIVQAGASNLPDDHPATDTNIDSTELYDEGVAGAAEVEDDSAESAVTDYDPEKDNEDNETL